MQNDNIIPTKLKSLYVISKVLAKLHHIKKQGEKEMAVDDLLFTLRFFQRFIADTTQRHQFLNVASDFMKFKFYTKGSAICHMGNPLSNLSILIDGRIGLFTPKESEELEIVNHDLRRNHVIEYYSDYIQEHKNRDKARSQTELTSGPVSPRKGKAYSLTQIKELGMGQPTAASTGLAHRVLDKKNTIIPDFLLESDLNSEEKLLLLAHHDQLDKCIFEGELRMKPVGYLNVGDTFGEETLLKTVPSRYTMVAMEDVYLVSLSREDYTFLFSLPELANASEKMQFLAKIFPDLTREARTKLAFYLEERVYSGREVIYREGVEADAIYMVKSGEVEYVTYEKPQKARSNTTNKLGPLAVQALKVSVGNLNSGTIFGEEEVVNSTIRKSSATAKQVGTFLYVLRKEVYHEMFSKHFPNIANVFRDWIQLKKVLKGEVETEPSEWPIKEKKSPILSPRIVIKTTASPKEGSEPIIERLKNKQNLLKIQSSIGIKAPIKTVPILDTIASPHYQEKRLKSLDFRRVNVNTLISLEQLNTQTQKIMEPVVERKQAPVVTSPALRSPKFSNVNLKTLEDIQEQKSNLFVFNQKQIDAKRRGSMSPRLKIPSSTKLVPLTKGASPFTFKESTPRNTDSGLVSELKKNLLISMSGAQTSRTQEKDSVIFDNGPKNCSLNSIGNSPLTKPNSNSILNVEPLNQPFDQLRLNLEKVKSDFGLKLEIGNILSKAEAKSGTIKKSHRRVKTHLGSPVKLGSPLDFEKLMLGTVPEKNVTVGISKRGV